MKNLNSIKNRILCNHYNDLLPSDLHKMTEMQLINHLKKVQKKENFSNLISALTVISSFLLPIICMIAAFNQ